MVIYNPDEHSSRLSLPYILPSQAQKHVTVNEALRKLDGIVQLTLHAAVSVVPPENPAPGDSHFVGADATGVWLDRDGQIATWQDGGWIFTTPQRGWRAYLLSENELAIFDGLTWTSLPTGTEPSPAPATPDRVNLIGGLDLIVNRYTLDLTAANQVDVGFQGYLPSHHLVFGLTAVITEAITGSTLINIGDAVSSYRFATRMSGDEGTQVLGLCNPPLVYWQPTDLFIRTGNARVNENRITGGKIDIVLYMLTFQYPLG